MIVQPQPMIPLPQISGLDHTDQNTLDFLIFQFRSKWPRNEMRSRYYDGRNVLKDFGISIPPQLKTVETVVGWPEKAVDALTSHCELDGFVIPGASTQELGIDDMWTDNRMDVDIPQALTSTLIHSTAFVATTLGDVQAGEPEVLITTRSAKSGTGIWNPRTRRLSAALSIIAYGERTPYEHSITELVMYLPDRVLTMVQNGLDGKWSLDSRKHSLGRVPVEPLVYRPNLDRPFGSSRISRAVMSITDEAVRTVLRTEVSAEFYSSPQRYMLGADPDAFKDASGAVRTGWEAILGRMLAISRDEEGDIPTVGQFPQLSMEPHIAHLRSAATRFSGATDLSVSSLGIVQDNPSSAEAIYAANLPLMAQARRARKGFGASLVNATRTGYMLLNKMTEPPKELNGLRANWADTDPASRTTAADATQKVVTAFPWMAESRVAVEQLGWDKTTIDRVFAEKDAMPPPPPPVIPPSPPGPIPPAFPPVPPA